jgi:hypothetical protein
MEVELVRSNCILVDIESHRASETGADESEVESSAT